MLDGNRRRTWTDQLPDGAGDLTLAELQEMSSRQQQQIEAQQQVLVAKEQRCRYLKQQEARRAQLVSESEQLKRFRERVENQELKLKKLRAMKGQTEQYRINNGHLTSELDAVRAVFNEKEKELTVAVARVDQLTQQLQELRDQGLAINGNQQPTATAELEKLRKELLIRNKLNEQQSNTIATKEKLLGHRREEVARMDARIHELQQRLKKRQSQGQQHGENKAKRPTAQPGHGTTRSNVATVEPYIKYASSNVIKPNLYKNTGNFIKQDPNYEILPPHVKLVSAPNFGKDGMIGPKTIEMNNNEFIEYELPTVLPADNRKSQIISQQQSTLSTNIINDRPGLNYSKATHTNFQTSFCPNPIVAATVVKPMSSLQAKSVNQNMGAAKHSNFHQTSDHPLSSRLQNVSERSQPDPFPVIFMSQSSSSLQPVIAIHEERQAGSGQSSPASTEGSDSSGGIQIVKMDSQVNNSSIGPVSAMIDRLNKTNGQLIKYAQPTTSQQNPDKPAKSENDLPSGYPTSQPLSSLSNVGHTHNPHLNQKPAATYRYASKNQIANTYMGRLGGAAMEKYQRNLNVLYKNMDFQNQAQIGDKRSKDESVGQADPAAGGEGHNQFGVAGSPNYPDIASDKGSYKLNTPKHIRRRHSDSENEDLNKALQERQELEQQRQQKGGGDQPRDNGAPQATTKINTSSSNIRHESQTSASESSSGKAKPLTDKGDASANKQEKTDTTSSSTSKVTDQMNKAETVVKMTKSILKKEGVRRSNNRISFDPLALLLDASLEGELDLVKKVAVQVDDVSTANDEGITALHNAICAGHYEIVKFLIEFGCDVNSPDSDGWTPLHCAASCNNLPMVRFLVEHGACVFATTISDQETAADKCEEDEDGYESCSDYLYSIQEKLGITNNGEVYAVFDYQANNTDELSFVIGDRLTVLKKGDEKEEEWWWSRLKGKDAYTPRNLLGLHSRVIQRPKEVSEC